MTHRDIRHPEGGPFATDPDALPHRMLAP
jgi:hypothetical protein